MPNSTVRRAAETKQAVVVLPRHNNNFFYTVIEIVNILRRPYKTYLTKLSSQNAEPFLITEITPNSIHVSEPNKYTILMKLSS